MKKNNHFVPKVYLKQWSANKKTVYSYNLIVPNLNFPIWREESIINTASLDFLYLYATEDGLSEVLEDYFSIELESKYINFMKKVNNNEKLNEEDKEYIAKLIASQHIRTIGGYLRIKEILDKIIPDSIDKVATKLEKGFDMSTMHKKKNYNSEFIPMNLSLVSNDEEEKEIKLEVFSGKSLWFFAVKHLLSDAFSILKDISWVIYDAPKDFEWVTSDDPVIFLNYYSHNNYDFKGGWAKKIQILFSPYLPKKYYLLK